MIEHDALIGQYTHERHRPRADEALTMLRKIASMVKPIMRKRGWRVGTLSEFYPDQQNLLGMNYDRGRRICIRLRYPSDHSLFLPLEETIDTMLHELSHNVFGPHNEKFHNLWNELRDEYEALIRKGYTGEGFLSAGQRLGGGNQKPIHEARRLARAAAEKRRNQGVEFGRRLGGAPPSAHRDIRQTIADAAQRRRDILKGCGSTEVDHDQQERIIEDAHRNAIQTAGDIDDADMRAIQEAFMEMVTEDQEHQALKNGLPMQKQGLANLSSEPKSSIDGNRAMPPPIPTLTKPVQSSMQNGNAESTNDWTCLACTYSGNPATYLACEVCLTERFTESSILDPPVARAPSKRPGDHEPVGSHKLLRSKTSTANLTRFKEAEEAKTLSKPIGWTCHSCGNFMESEWWTCAACGTMKQSS